MFTMKLAGVCVAVENQYDYTEQMCRDYLAPGETPDFTVRITPEDIRAEWQEGWSEPYLENLAIHRKITKKLIEYDGFLMHGVVLETEGAGVAFLAESGVGKSTHGFLWQKLLGDRVTIINGDKPLVRLEDGALYAYGTPWAGKEGLQTNTRCRLEKLCFLSRSGEPSCVLVDYTDGIFKMFPFLYMEPGDHMRSVLKLLDGVTRRPAFYDLRCNMELASAETSYRALFPGHCIS